jgi:hypothetical protein
MFADPERCQALQVVDIIVGGIAFKLNGHYDKPDANRYKRALCDYLLIYSSSPTCFIRRSYTEMISVR